MELEFWAWFPDWLAAQKATQLQEVLLARLDEQIESLDKRIQLLQSFKKFVAGDSSLLGIFLAVSSMEIVEKSKDSAA